MRLICWDRGRSRPPRGPGRRGRPRSKQGPIVTDLTELEPLETRLADWLPGRRWFGGKGRPIAAVRFVDHAVLAEGGRGVLLGLLEVTYTRGERERYFVPL